MKKLLFIIIICTGFYTLFYKSKEEATLPTSEIFSCEFSKKSITQYELTRLNNHINSWSFFTRVESMINTGYLNLNSPEIIKQLEKNFQNSNDTVERAYILWTLSKINPQNKLIEQNQQKFYDRVITQYHKNNMMFLASHIAFLSSSNAASSASQKQQMHSIMKLKIDEWLGFHNHKDTKEKAYAIFALHEIGTSQSLALKSELLRHIENLYDRESTQTSIRKSYKTLINSGYAAHESIPHLLEIKTIESKWYHDDILETLLKINPHNENVQNELKKYISKNLNNFNKKSLRNLHYLQPYSNCTISEVEKIFKTTKNSNDIILQAGQFIISSPQKLNEPQVQKISYIAENSEDDSERKKATSILEANNNLSL